MLRVETTFSSYRCPKLKEDVDIRIDRLRDVDTNRIVSQKFECDKTEECCLNTEASADFELGCPHPESKEAQHENSAGA